MLETVRLALDRIARSPKHYECRRCGTGLQRSNAECPACESSEVASYEL